jgi:hypothetical protein
MKKVLRDGGLVKATEKDAAGVSEEALAALQADGELGELQEALGGFNIFRLLGFEHGELRHSRVLAWLLGPEGSHGFGERFLRNWLGRVLRGAESGSAIRLKEVATAPFRSVRVLREWEQIDVLVQIQLEDGGQWVIAVENKVRATQGATQLMRYRKQIERNFPSATKLFVFLTVGEEAPDDEAWVPARHAQIAEVLDGCLRDYQGLGGDHLVLLRHYLQVLRSFTMTDKQLVTMARQLYKRHPQAIDFIIEQQKDRYGSLSQAVEDRMIAASRQLDIVPMRCAKGFVRFLPKAWDTPANRAGTAWGQEGSAYILCEIVLRNDRPYLKMVEGHSPTGWRSDLFEIAKREKSTLHVRKAMSLQWMSVYHIHTSALGPEDDVETLANIVWGDCERHLREDQQYRKAVELIADQIGKLPAP